MPVYRYKVLNPDIQDEFFEIEQKINDRPLLVHPITGYKVIRVLTSPSLSLNHSSGIENNSLSPDNLSKHGFTKYKKTPQVGTFIELLDKKGLLLFLKNKLTKTIICDI